MTTKIGGLEIRRTSELINNATRLCGLVMGRPKFGKTSFGATLHNFTLKHYGKPTLFIALEAAEGGGTTTIQDYDVPYVQPANWKELSAVVAQLQTDSEFAGVVLDNATDMVGRVIKPHALTFPTRGAPGQARLAGVPDRGDYQIMGELTRQILNQLINLTKLPSLDHRKHLLVTVLEKERQDDGIVTAVTPDLPGAMADTAAAMFEVFMGIKVGNSVRPDPSNPKLTIRESTRLMTTKGDGRKQLGDRYKLFPQEGPLDWVQLMEEYWLPKVAAVEARRAA